VFLFYIALPTEIGASAVGADLAFTAVVIMFILGHRRSLDLKSTMNGWKYDLNVIAGADMLGQLSGYIESEDLEMI